MEIVRPKAELRRVVPGPAREARVGGQRLSDEVSMAFLLFEGLDPGTDGERRAADWWINGQKDGGGDVLHALRLDPHCSGVREAFARRDRKAFELA
eukprot:3936578-Rhodomonas_salina.1